MHSHSSSLFFCFCLLALPVLAQAQTEHHETGNEFHPHHLSVFSGATSQLGEPGATSNQNVWYTVGLDYEFRFHNLLGISAFTEYLFASHEEFLFGLPVFLHPWHGLKFNASPLLALAYEAEEGDGHHDETKSWHSKYGFRIELGYDFMLDKFSFTPIVNYDRVDGHPELNYGLAFGMGF